MNIKVSASEYLDSLGKRDLILLGSQLATRIGKRQGERLLLKDQQGEKLPLTVALAGDSDKAWVSRWVYRKIREGTYKTSLGCDPEFVFVDKKGRVCPADSFLKKEGMIGHDGVLGELRPNPAYHEDEVVDNLRKLIKTLPLLLGQKFGDPGSLVPEAHSEKKNYALGFHLHLGTPKELLLFAAPGSYEFVNLVIGALDYYVGLPSMLVEDNNRRRLGDGLYGALGDWRISQRTLEYRTPGGFNLRHPDYARGLMALGLCVFQSVLSWAEEKSISWTRLDRITNSPIMCTQFDLPDRREVSRAFNSRSKLKAYAFLPKIISGLEKMEFFAGHQDSIRKYLKFSLDKTEFAPQILKNW